MINANEYETREDLEKAMYQMHREQLVQLMFSKYGAIKGDIEQMSSLTRYPFANKCAALDKHTIYWTADRIEELARRLALTCSIMKRDCRLILDEPKGEKMRIDQPHLSVKVTDKSQSIEFLEKKIEETQKVVDELIEGKERVQSFLKHQDIDEAVVAEKLLALSKKIEQLSNSITELKHIIEICTDDMSPLYQYFKEHAEELEESEDDI